MCADVIEQGHQIVYVRHEIGQNDHIERLPELDVFTRRLDEPQLRMTPTSLVDHRAAQIHADATCGREGREEISRPASDLEHGSPGWHVKPIDVLDQIIDSRGSGAAMRQRWRQRRRRTPPAPDNGTLSSAVEAVIG